MNEIYKIVQALKQIEANTFPGALDKGGKPRDDMPIGKSNNGFKLSISGERVVIKYQEELDIRRVQDKNFNSEVEQKFADILKYLKKEYKEITGNSLSLKKESEIDVLIQSLSRFRTWINASQIFSLSGLKDQKKKPSTSLDEGVREFLASSPKYRIFPK